MDAWLLRACAKLRIKLVHSQPGRPPLTGQSLDHLAGRSAQCTANGQPDRRCAWCCPACRLDWGGSDPATGVPCLIRSRCGCREAGNAGGSRAGGGPATGSCATTTSATWPTGATPRPASAPTRSTCCTSPAGWTARTLGLDAVDTDALLRYLAACRAERRAGQHDNVISLASGRASGFAPATINRRLAAVSGLFSFRSMRDPAAVEPGAAGPGRAAGRRRGANRAAGSPGPAQAAVEAAGPRAAAAAPRAGPGRDRRAAVQLPHRPGPGDRRADAAVRAALGRGARAARRRRGYRPRAGCG